MTKEHLYDLYIIQNMSISQIERENNITRRQIDKLLKKYGIPKKTMSETINGIKHKISYKRTAKEQEIINEKRKETNLLMYGVENPAQLDEIRQKMKETNLLRYGVEHPIQLDEIKQKQKDTALRQYGVEHPIQLDEIKQKHKDTMLKRYGVENPGQMKDHSDKLIKAWSMKTSSEREDIKSHREQTMLERYGLKYLIYDKQHYNKMKSGMLEKYHVEHGFHCDALRQKAMVAQSSTDRYKNFVFPSGKTVRVMGYEPQFLTLLLSTHDESDIMVGYSNVPAVPYVSIEGHNRIYYPDIYVPSSNTLYEVKSEYTYLIDEENNLLKHYYAISNGYNHIIVILSKNGEILNEIS